MTLDEIRGVLEQAITLRIPRFDPSLSPRAKISQLESYLLLAATRRGELEEALYWLWEAQKRVQDQWDAIDRREIEPLLPTNRKSITQDTVRQAKRQLRPSLYDALDHAERLKEHLARQIRRLERDSADVSRAYTMLTGS